MDEQDADSAILGMGFELEPERDAKAVVEDEGKPTILRYFKVGEPEEDVSILVVVAIADGAVVARAYWCLSPVEEGFSIGEYTKDCHDLIMSNVGFVNYDDVDIDSGVVSYGDGVEEEDDTVAHLKLSFSRESLSLMYEEVHDSYVDILGA